MAEQQEACERCERPVESDWMQCPDCGVSREDVGAVPATEVSHRGVLDAGWSPVVSLVRWILVMAMLGAAAILGAYVGGYLAGFAAEAIIYLAGSRSCREGLHCLGYVFAGMLVGCIVGVASGVVILSKPRPRAFFFGKHRR